jgi:hypothetical protein
MDVPGSVAGGSVWRLLGRGIDAATGAAVAVALARSAGVGRSKSGGGGQRAYLRGPGEAGDTGCRRRLVLCGGGGSYRVAAAAVTGQNVSGTGHPGHELRVTAAAITSCSGECSGGVGQLVGQG